MEVVERITVDPEQCSGRPCIRGMRIRVTDVLDLFAAGLSAEEILGKMPDLQAEDLQACTASERRDDGCVADEGKKRACHPEPPRRRISSGRI
ncbi:MAG TPA: DUF433 domain-containing protein [Thermoanaerobaculia bacterium]|nr:DUF433 domain-containing protein [Thermoanaerobaculia bacterium]